MRIARVVMEDKRIAWCEEREGRFFRLKGSLYEGLKATEREVHPARFLPPVDPPNIIALGMNYRGHAREIEKPLPAEPQFFLKATSSLIGEGQQIVLPVQASAEVDYEAELGLIVGREARNVDPGEAHRFILGYLCANDVSARDCQFRRDVQWNRAKSFDTFCPVGRLLITGLDPLDLGIRCLLNGAVMQDSRTSDMVFDPFQTLSFLSFQMTLKTGTLILTGTPGGVGFTRQPPVFLKDGDEVEVWIEGLGSLKNRVVRQS